MKTIRKKRWEKIKKKAVKKTAKKSRNTKKTFGIFIGRFQPFHLGHLRDVKKALSKVDFLMIIVGSAQEKRTERNPLSAPERKRIIKTALAAEKIQKSKYAICCVNDHGNHYSWVNKVIEVSKKARQVNKNNTLVFCGTESSGHFTARLLAKKGYRIIKLKLLKGISGTRIRRLIRENKNNSWQHLVPKNIVEEIKNKI